MKTAIPLLLALLFTLGLGTSAQARLGETEDVLIQRYGKIALKERLPWCERDHFSVNGFLVTVTLLKGISYGETYHRLLGDLTDDQVQDLLAANAQGYLWTPVPQAEMPKDIYHPLKQMWTRPSGSTAVLTTYAFEVKSIYLIIAEQDANKPPPAASTAGF